MGSYQNVLGCTDFSDAGNRAADRAIRLARDSRATLTLVHVVEPPALPNPLYAHYSAIPAWDEDAKEKTRASVRDELAALVKKVDLDSQLTTINYLAPIGDPAEEILNAVEEVRPDVLVTGTHGRTGFKRFVMGSIAERIVRLADVDVLVVHAGE